jgi:hypothetical protein
MPYDNRDRGALFRGDRKESDSDPDFSGTLDVEGRPYWINGWLKTSRAGKKFVSLSVKPKTDYKPRPSSGRSAADSIDF